MSTRTLPKVARAMPFAHFFGFGPSAEDSSDLDDTGNDERKQRDGESDEDYAARMDELDKDDKPGAADPKDDDPCAGDVDGDDADAEDTADDKEAGRRAGRAQGARQRERERCAAIVAAGIKGGRVNLACSFAFDSKLTAAQAISSLKAAGMDAAATAPRRQTLADRMDATVVPNPGPNGGGASGASSPAKALADKIVATAERVRGK